MYKNSVCKVGFLFAVDTRTFRMLNLGCGQYLRNPFFQDFGVKSGGAGCVFLRIIHGCILYIANNMDSGQSEQGS